MKTQRNHLERQLQHSHDLARARCKIQQAKQVVKYTRIGWGLVGAWVLWVVVIIIGGV